LKREKYRVREDWINMAPSDWMEMTPAEWMDRMMSGWNQSYSDLMSARPSDWWDMMYGSGLRERMPWTRDRQERRHRRHRHHHECTCGAHDYYEEHHHQHEHDSCRRCGTTACECYCCLGDVDLAIYAHVGEQRLIQLVIENERHREKEISLDLSEWTTRGGSPAPVKTVGLAPKAFTLAACAEQQVSLMVTVGAARQTDDDKEAESTSGGDIALDRQSRQRVDVDDCLIATADLRLVGCDHRPLRIAVAILPRDCEAYRVTCGCTCC
jgi:hypothetical protein